MKVQNSLAYIMTVCKAMIYGSSILFTGALLKSTSVMDVLALRFLISAIAFLLLAATGVIHVNFRGKPLKILAATAIFEPVFYFLFETIGVGQTTTSLAGIMSALLPVVIILCETIFLHERTSTMQKLLLMLSISGVILVTVLTGNDSNQSNSVWGIVFLALAYASGALFMICSRKSSSKFTSAEITFFMTMVGALVFNGINVTRHLSAGTITTYFDPLLKWENLLGFLFLSILSSIIATLMNNYALSRIQASSISALGGISTITSIFLGVIVNDETLFWYHYVGMVMILVGGIGVNYIAQRRLEKSQSK